MTKEETQISACETSMQVNTKKAKIAIYSLIFFVLIIYINFLMYKQLFCCNLDRFVYFLGLSFVY